MSVFRTLDRLVANGRIEPPAVTLAATLLEAAMVQPSIRGFDPTATRQGAGVAARTIQHAAAVRVDLATQAERILEGIRRDDGHAGLFVCRQVLLRGAGIGETATAWGRGWTNEDVARRLADALNTYRGGVRWQSI